VIASGAGTGSARGRGVRTTSLAATESPNTSGLNIRVIESQEGTLVSLRGRIFIESSPGLRDRLLAILERASPLALTIDLSEVPYIDLSGIATLVEALKIARVRKREMKLTGLHDRPPYLLERTGLLPLFEAHGSIRGFSELKVQ